MAQTYRPLYILWCCLLFIAASAAAAFTPVLPPSYPLAVKTPYLSVWLPGNETANLPSAVPRFWYGQQLQWSVIARVDGKAYSLFGVPKPGDNINPGSLVHADYSSTHTTFTVTAGSADFVLDFFSPVSPGDLVRQSLPFSYLTVSATQNSANTPSIQVYSDIDLSWTGQFVEPTSADYTFATSFRGTQVFTMKASGTALFSESDQMAKWGSAVYCTRPNESNLTSKVGEMDEVRSDFAANGSISGPWTWNAGSVVAHSQDLSFVSSAKKVTFVIGYVADPSINYLGDVRTNYWRSACSDINCACVRALDDYPAADAGSRSLDTAIASKAAAAAGGNYSDIVALSVRQAFGAMDVTIPADSLDTADVMAFVKEISSDGNVNTVDVLMPVSPILYVIAPNFIRLTLEPVMRYLKSGAWPLNYTIHDIGFNYPNVSAHNNGTDEPMPVEECGNSIVLAYMYQLATGDKNWARQYSAQFQQYADYLVQDGLHPASQLSTDDGAGNVTNQTGLAVKAAVALNAYGQLSGQQHYSSTGLQFANILYNQSAGTDSDRTHFTLIQGNSSSWSLHFNLYLDVLLNLKTFPTEAYAMQSSYYPSVRGPTGVALDSNVVTWGKTDWMIFAAATAMAPGVGNQGVRDMFIDDVHTFMTNGRNAVPFSDRFYVQNNGSSNAAGDCYGYTARPVVGGHFAILALNGPNQLLG